MGTEHTPVHKHTYKQTQIIAALYLLSHHTTHPTTATRHGFLRINTAYQVELADRPRLWLAFPRLACFWCPLGHQTPHVITKEHQMGTFPILLWYKYSSLGQACPFLGLTFFICTVRARPRSVTLNSFFSFQQQNLCFSPVFQGCIIGYETDRMELPQLLRIWGSVLSLPLPSPRAPLPDSTEHSVVLAHLPAISSSPSPNSVDGWERGRVATRSASHGSLPTANPY